MVRIRDGENSIIMYGSFHKAMEQLKAFDIAIYQARKSSSQILLVMPDEIGQLLLKRASQLLAKKEDFNGNLCSADTLASIYDCERRCCTNRGYGRRLTR